MKLLIISDIHGCLPALERVLAFDAGWRADKMLLLGDLLYHGPRNKLPEGYDPAAVAQLLNAQRQRIVAVRGNCDAEVDQMVLDFPCQADYALLELEGRLLYLTHGHVAGMTPDSLPPLPAGSAYASGHTHVKVLERAGETLLINPGSISIPKDGSASFATYQDGSFTLRALDGTPLTAVSWS